MFENTFFELSIGLADVNFTAAFASNLVNDPLLLASFAKHTFPEGLVGGAAVAGFEIKFIYYPAHQLDLSIGKEHLSKVLVALVAHLGTNEAKLVLILQFLDRCVDRWPPKPRPGSDRKDSSFVLGRGHFRLSAVILFIFL